MKISPARIAAFDILLRIEREKAYSSVLLPQFEADLSTLDRGLCHSLTLGTLRRQMLLDHVIDRLTNGKKIDIEIRIALRLGLFQLNYLDKIPQYSAINESVNLVQRAKKTSAKGFVNAILRRASRESIDFTHADDIEKIAIETSHPKWLIQKWSDVFGADAAASFAQSNNEKPNIAFRFIGENSIEGQRLFSDSRPSAYVEGCFILVNDNDDLRDLAEKGEIYLQDEASQLVAQAVRRPENLRFFDVCAAPGGKTGLIANNMSQQGSMIVAGDLHRQRVEYLKDNCIHQRVGNVEVVRYDAEKSLPFESHFFDSVLVDAPCSGTGTIRHNPEIRYFLDASDITDLAMKQRSILNEASKVVRHGGELIYSTCSVEREENEDVCSEFLRDHADFCCIRPRVEDRFITDDGYARTWPNRHDMDGFFIAAFKRK